jgi:hypothetical protein
MRTIEEVVGGYNDTKQGDRKKIQLIEWFQKHPQTRFDVVEVTDAMGDELAIGQGQIRNHLNELVDDGVLRAHGESRKGYELAEDIIVPDRYQMLVAFNHLSALFDIRRWGIPGFLTIVTLVWAVLTFPFWFMWGTLSIFPMDSYGPITKPEFLHLAFSMTLWLIVFFILVSVGYRLRRYYREHQ